MLNSNIEFQIQKELVKPLLKMTVLIVTLLFVAPGEAFAANAYLRDNAPQFIDKIEESYGEMVNIAALLHDTDPKLILAVIVVESEGNETVTSHKGALGLMQLMPRTAKSMGAKNPKEPFQNILAGTKYLKQLENIYGFERTEDALVAYNMGPTRARRWLSQYSADDYTYVRNVMYVHQILSDEEDERERVTAALEAKLAQRDRLFDTESLLSQARLLSLATFPAAISTGRKSEVETEN